MVPLWLSESYDNATVDEGHPEDITLLELLEAVPVEALAVRGPVVLPRGAGAAQSMASFSQLCLVAVLGSPGKLRHIGGSEWDQSTYLPNAPGPGAACYCCLQVPRALRPLPSVQCSGHSPSLQTVPSDPLLGDAV